jgi:hypothetical protein
MSAEKNFQSESFSFLFVFWALLLVLNSVLGSVFSVLACASMLFSVTFNVGMLGVWDVEGAVKSCAQEEGDDGLSPSSIMR